METRTASEVLAYKDADDVFGFAREALATFLTWDEARPWLKPEATNEDGSWTSRARTRENGLDELTAYVRDVGLDKAVSHRGISAGRTIVKLRALAWLMADDEAVRLLDERPYENYGAPKVRALCEHLGIDWQALLDAGGRLAFTRMSEGRQCCDDCDEGCSR